MDMREFVEVTKRVSDAQRVLDRAREESDRATTKVLEADDELNNAIDALTALLNTL